MHLHTACRAEYCRKGRDSSAGIATRHELGGPGIGSRWGARFSTPVQTALEPTQPPVQWVKQSGRGVNYPPSSSAEVKGKVELYLYFHSGPSEPVIGRTLPFHNTGDCFGNCYANTQMIYRLLSVRSPNLFADGASVIYHHESGQLNKMRY